MCLFIKEIIYRSVRNCHEAHLLGEARTRQRSRELHIFNKRYRENTISRDVGGRELMRTFIHATFRLYLLFCDIIHNLMYHIIPVVLFLINYSS